MIDLGKKLFERQYFFDELKVEQIVVNPNLQHYPQLFLICRERRGQRLCEYAVGLGFLQLNTLLMRHVDNDRRLNVAAALSDALLSPKASRALHLREFIGSALMLRQVDVSTCLRRFQGSPESDDEPIYFFEIIAIAEVRQKRA